MAASTDNLPDRTELSLRHAREWATFRREHLDPCIAAGDESQAKFIKTIADSLRIAQDSERRALLFCAGALDETPTEVEWSE